MATDEILSAFVNSNRLEMTLIELRQNFRNHVSNVELIQFLKQSNLFEVQSTNLIVKLNPKLILCVDCLQKGCQNKRSCTQLHLCRYASHFNTNKPLEKPCTFPHKLTDLPQNVLLLRQYKYDLFDEHILLKLLRLFYEKTSGQPSVRIQKSKDNQIDVVIPSETEAKDVDLEIVQLLLATQDINVEHIPSKDQTTEFYRRYTLQFPTSDLVEKFLETNSIIVYNEIPIKFKRTERKRDSKLIALKFLTSNSIDRMRLNLYVEALVGKDQANIFDMTNEGSQEQIYLIQCQQNINLEHLHKAHSAKSTLQGFQVLIVEVYESESLEISYLNKSSMSYSKLRQILGDKRWHNEIFTCRAIREHTTAEIELFNSEITSQWLSQARSFEEKYSLRIHPIIDFISNESETNPNENYFYTIKPTWRIVLTHRIFGDEYRKYIREKLNLSIQITGSNIQVPSNHLRQELARLTNMFIQNFQFHQFTKLDKAQVKIIKDNYSRMAHKWQPDTQTTWIAARREVINELLPQLSASKHQTVFYPIENPSYFPFFSSTNIFPEHLRTYLSDKFHVQLEIQSNSSAQIQLILKGLPKDLSDARANLTPLFASLKTMIFRNNQYSIPDVARLAQSILNRSSMISSCSFSTKSGGFLTVNYFTENSQFAIDEQRIEEILSKRISYCFIQIKTSTVNFENQLQNLLKTIEQRRDYGEEICFVYHRNSSVELAGTKAIVQQIEANCQKLIDEFTPIACRVALQTNQMKYLIQFCSNELMKFERTHETDGVDLRTKFKSNSAEFLAPKYLHEKIKLFLLDLSKLQPISKDLSSSTQNHKTLTNNLAKTSRCLTTGNSSSSSSIRISNGDLSTEQSDVLVICSTSVYLCQAMIKAAGATVEQEIHGQDLKKSVIDTSTGQLEQAKRLLFIPWSPPSQDLSSQNDNALRQSIAAFINQAMNFTIAKGFQSIAFPAIGCGGFRISPDLVASTMINTVQETLKKNPTVQITVTFVVQQKNIFDIFQMINSKSTNDN